MHPAHTGQLPGVHECRLLTCEEVTPMVDWVRTVCTTDIETHAAQTPELEGTHVAALSSRIWDLRFRSGVWDKQLHRMSCACRVLEEDRVIHSYLGGDRFVLWGVAENKSAAQAAVVYDTLMSAQAHGIVDAAVRHNLLRKGYTDLHWAADHVNSVYPDPMDATPLDDADPGPRQHRPKALFGAPSIFSILKWKTVEQGAEACVKWRDIVSFKFHILRSYARLISRSLQLVVSEVYRLLQTLGMPTMTGVRDMLGSLGRFMPVWSTVQPDEADMADMFWHIPKDDVVPSLNLIFTLLERERRGCAEFFSLHKSGEKTLDRIGTATCADFRVISRSELLAFVEWDLHHNTGLVLGQLLLRQGDRGVPIGGHLSAQLAELWALARELGWVFGERKPELMKAWQEALRARACDSKVPVDISDVCLSVIDPVEQVHASSHPSHSHGRVLASTDRASVFRGILRQDGFGGWWSPTDFSFGSLDISGVRIDLLATSLWDAAPDGRMGTVVACAPPRDRALLNDFFKELDPVECVIGEAKRGWCGWSTRVSDPEPPVSAQPGVLFSRFRDNIYIIFMNICPALFPKVREAVMVFLNCLYGIPLKWEPTSVCATWGECAWRVLPLGFSLTRKGVIWSLTEGATCGEWLRWVPAGSANARFTLTSMLPSLFLKSVWYAASQEDIVANFRSLVWGVGWNSYPKHWWLPCLQKFVRRYGLSGLISLGSVTTWVREGKQARAAHLGVDTSGESSAV